MSSDRANLTDTRLSPRRADRGICYVENDAILLFRFCQPASEFERSHPAEGVSAEHLHDRSLIQIRSRGADRLQSVQKLGCKLRDRNVSTCRNNGDSLRGRKSAEAFVSEKQLSQ